jgi:hypothetical protein
MATDKDKLMKGIRLMAVGFPFIFMGPALMYWLGIPGLRNENYIAFTISIVLMGLAGFFCVKGLRTILSAFFDKPKA